ncbi:MAG: histidine--tRNA ligase [Acidimicrobiales bacterium]
MAPQFQAPKGTRDIIPPESGRWRALVEVFAATVEQAGYGPIYSPLFEDIEVFQRVGDSTEIVTKEMYDFRDKGDRHIALRPELTASVARAFAQHRPVTPWKVWYEGPQFRYEEPQAGRYRQFSQVGVEIIGADDPHADVEVIALAARFYERLGMRQVRLLLNSLGDDTCRPSYLEALTAYFSERRADLSEASQETLAKNPLRVLDSKRPEDQQIVDAAPVMVDYLSDDTAAHFASVRDGLDALGIRYEISPRLVRGLDYYSRTTFEFVADALDTAQNAVGGGGHYDQLIEALGGPATPGIGFALGIDRILLACDAEGVFASPAAGIQVFVVDVTGGKVSLQLTDELRTAGIGAERAFGGRSMKAQMKVADRSGARLALIIGDDELAANKVSLRDLRTKGEQELIDRSTLVDELRKRLTDR